jgi:hypothetical protein
MHANTYLHANKEIAMRVNPFTGEKRLTLSLSPLAYARLCDLQQEMGCRSVMEVVQKAVEVYEKLWEGQRQGGKVCMHLGSEQRVVDL